MSRRREGDRHRSSRADDAPQFKVVTEMKGGLVFAKRSERLLVLSHSYVRIFEFPVMKLLVEIPLRNLVVISVRARETQESERASVTLHYKKRPSSDSSESSARPTSTKVATRSEAQLRFQCCHRSFLTSQIYRFQDMLEHRRDKSFRLKKWNKKFLFVDAELHFCSATLVRVKSRYRRPFNLMDISNIYLYDKQRSIVVIKYEGYRVHFFKLADENLVKRFIETITRALDRYLKMTIEPVQISESDFRRLREKTFVTDSVFAKFTVDKIKEGYRYSDVGHHHLSDPWEQGWNQGSAVDGERGRSSYRGQPRNENEFVRALVLNETFVIEKTHDERMVLSVHDVADVSSLILYVAKPRKLGIEYLCESKVYRYKCMSPQQRDAIVMDILTLSRFGSGRAQVSINIEETRLGLREGRIIPPHIEYAKKHFIRRFATLDEMFGQGWEEGQDAATGVQNSILVARLYNQAIPLLKEFNMSYRPGECDVFGKRKSLYSLCLGLIDAVLEDFDATHLDGAGFVPDPSERRRAAKARAEGSADAPGGVNDSVSDFERIEAIQVILLTILKLLSTRGIFDEVNHYQLGFQNTVVRCLLFPKQPMIRFCASLIVVELLTSPLLRKNRTLKIHQEFIFSQENLIYLLQTMVRDAYDSRFEMSFYHILYAFEYVLKTDLSPELNSLLTRSLFGCRQVLYHFCNSLSESMQLQGTRLLNIIAIRLSNADLLQMQKDVLLNGLLLRHVFRALFTKRTFRDKDEFRELDEDTFFDLVYSFEDETTLKEHSLAVVKESLLFVDLFASFYSPAIRFLKQVIPEPLQEDVKLDLVRNDADTQVGIFGMRKKRRLEIQSQGWAFAFEEAQKDYENIDLVWNDETRQALKVELRAQLRSLDAMGRKYDSSSFVWNHEEFSFDSAACIDEIRIGKYYLRFLGNEQQELKIEDPMFYLKQICYSFFFEREDKRRLIFIDAIRHVFKTFLKDQEFPHLRKIVATLREKDLSLELVYGTLQAVNETLDVKENVFSINDIFVPLLIPFVKKVHLDELKYGSIIEVILDILYKLSASHTMKVQTNQLIYPVSTPTKILSSQDCLPYIVQLLLCPYNKTIIEKTYFLLYHLLKSNQELIPHFYRTGALYFILSREEGFCAESFKLFHVIHPNQRFKRRKFRLGRKDPMLSVFFPDALIRAFETESPQGFLKLFYGETNSETLIWNDRMRLSLQSACEKHILEFKTSILTNEFLKYRHKAVKKIRYEELNDTLFVGGYYLKRLFFGDTERDLREVITQPMQLFSDLQDSFLKEKNDEKLITLMEAQKILIDKCISGSSYTQEYRAMQKCFDLLCNSRSRPMMQACLELVKSLLQFDHLVHLCIKFKIPEICVSLLKRIFSQAAAIVQEYREVVRGAMDIASALVCPNAYAAFTDEEFLQILVSLYRQMDVFKKPDEEENASDTRSRRRRARAGRRRRPTRFRNEEEEGESDSEEEEEEEGEEDESDVEEEEDADFRFYSELMSLISKLLCVPAILDSFWKCGMCLYLLRNLYGGKTPLVNQSLQLLSRFLVQDLMDENSDNFVRNDLTLVLPSLLVSKLSSDPNAFFKMFLRKIARPNLVWEETCRIKLQCFVEKKIRELQSSEQRDDALKLFEELDYGDEVTEFQVGGLYLRIYLLTEFRDFVVPDPANVVSLLIQELYNARKYDEEELHLVFQTLETICTRTKDHWSQFLEHFKLLLAIPKSNFIVDKSKVVGLNILAKVLRNSPPRDVKLKIFDHRETLNQKVLLLFRSIGKAVQQESFKKCLDIVELTLPYTLPNHCHEGLLFTLFVLTNLQMPKDLRLSTIEILLEMMQHSSIAHQITLLFPATVNDALIEGQRPAQFLEVYDRDQGSWNVAGRKKLFLFVRKAFQVFLTSKGSDPKFAVTERFVYASAASVDEEDDFSVRKIERTSRRRRVAGDDSASPGSPPSASDVRRAERASRRQRRRARDRDGPRDREESGDSESSSPESSPKPPRRPGGRRRPAFLEDDDLEEDIVLPSQSLSLDRPGRDDDEVEPAPQSMMPRARRGRRGGRDDDDEEDAPPAAQSMMPRGGRGRRGRDRGRDQGRGRRGRKRGDRHPPPTPPKDRRRRRRKDDD